MKGKIILAVLIAIALLAATTIATAQIAAEALSNSYQKQATASGNGFSMFGAKGEGIFGPDGVFGPMGQIGPYAGLGEYYGFGYGGCWWLPWDTRYT